MLRLILLILLFLFSLLVLFKAPTFHLWLAAILVTEFSLIFFLTTVVVLISGIWFRRYQAVGSIFGIFALIIYLSPVVKASLIGNKLPNELSHAFKGKVEKNQVFSFWGIISRINKRTVEPKELTYVSYSDKSLKMNFYPSQIKGIKPCVIVVHGGSWKGGNNMQLPELNDFLADTGYHVAAINYRLAPEFKNPAPVEDVAAAINYLKRHAKELAIDTTRLVLLGRSAGAQIALLAAYTLQEPGLRGVIGFYGPADMVWGYSVPANPLVLNSRKVMEDYLGGTYDAVPENYKRSSPIEYVNNSSVPTLIIHGENDVLVAYEHSTKLKTKLTTLGVPNYFLSLSWATHGFDYNINGPGGQLSTYTVKQFLDLVTRQ